MKCVTKKYLWILIAVNLPMCSSKCSGSNQTEQRQEATSAPVAAPTAPPVDTEWSKEIDELLEKTAGLAALADTTHCLESHDALVNYMKIHRARLEELSIKVSKMDQTISLEKKMAFEKKMSTDYDVSMGVSLKTMANFAQLCCNRELPREKAYSLEDSLMFIRTLQSMPRKPKTSP